MRKIIIRIEDDIPEGEALLMVHNILHSNPKDNGKRQIARRRGNDETCRVLWKRNRENSHTFTIQNEKKRENTLLHVQD